jgi:uncharacterized protein (DUF433 family)
MSNIVEHPHVEFVDGRWYVKGTKVPAFRIYTWHRRGTTFETLFKRYSQLGPAKVLSAAAFMYDNEEMLLDAERASSRW